MTSDVDNVIGLQNQMDDHVLLSAEYLPRHGDIGLLLYLFTVVIKHNKLPPNHFTEDKHCPIINIEVE